MCYYEAYLPAALNSCWKLTNTRNSHISALSFCSSNLIGEVCVLEDMTSHLPVIEIRIEECRGEAFYYGYL